MTNFRNRIFEQWKPRGFRFFQETIWSSSLQRADLPRVQAFCEKNSFDNVDVALLNPPDSNTPRYRWNRHYEGSGQCVSLMQSVPLPAGSNYLKLTFCYVTDEARREGHNQIIVVANSLRIVFGVPIARELIFSHPLTEDKPEPGIASDVGFASPFDTQSLNIFSEPPIEGSTLMPIPEDAAILLDKAFAQAFPHERFVLLWLAFEAVVHSHPGGGENGRKRERFFKDELKSDVVNAEVFRLFELRNDAFKEGRFSHPNYDKESWSLYAVLQLAVMRDCPQRRAFLSGLENVLKGEARRRHEENSSV